ncbi:DUF1640 domain-containing protein [Enterococcus faecalis]|uniref:DUF1640 domain-containing protein n=1 Tax=Enterococcus faecalis TaxID=1351 RepID=UPI000358D896|nr:DUF1640 domain-containing protein [Enterococcus faecalis]EPR46301.1 hypothetical protein EF10244_08885 [Enterococcus faecalis 10244]TBH18888.1 DUF1640 domain-containing protein [Enterococcus faecalis]
MNKKLWDDDKIVPMRKDGSGGGMGNDNYVTHRELELTKESIERKIDTTESNLKMELSNIDHKIENSIFELKEEFRKQKNANIKWAIGTAIAIVSVIVAVLKFFI